MVAVVVVLSAAVAVIFSVTVVVVFSAAVAVIFSVVVVVVFSVFVVEGGCGGGGSGGGVAIVTVTGAVDLISLTAGFSAHCWLLTGFLGGSLEVMGGTGFVGTSILLFWDVGGTTGATGFLTTGLGSSSMQSSSKSSGEYLGLGL